MHRKRSISAVLAAFCIASVVLVFTMVGSAAAKVGAHQAAKITIVTVTAGKPTELGFKLSKFSNLPAGTITFKVTNEGLGFHNFKICTTPTTSLAKNACLGKVTKLLHPGNTATLTVKLTKSGKYEYLCAVPGHAAAGMKGLIGIGVKVSPSASAASEPTTTSSAPVTTTRPTPTTTTPTPTTTTTPGGGGVVSECPPGQTIAVNGGKDDDADDGGAPTDNDGCI
jgi:uncharacterized cupredoxin-like copper-binding protein